MFFTQEDYKKIQQWLAKNSVKDTEFNEANIPFNGEETITIVQGNQNKKVFLKDLVAQVFNLGISDFVNITDKYDAPNISLEEAIRLIPSRARKEGQVITFLNKEDGWNIYQFKGALNQWNILDQWKDLFETNIEDFIIDSILPDEEDLTKSVPDENGNSYLSLKDREYNPEDFSGLGRVILRKNIVEIEDPVYGKVNKNVLYQDMINKENTIYEIRYDFDLNGAEITVPEGCVLDFQGGSINNGHINFNYSRVEGKVKCYSRFSKIGNAEIYISWFTNKKSTEALDVELEDMIDAGAGRIIYLDRAVTVSKTIMLKNGITIRGITYNNGTFIYPSNNFEGESVFDVNGDRNEGGWMFRIEISNMWITLSNCKSSDTLKNIFKINQAYGVTLSNIKTGEFNTLLTNLDVANCTAITCHSCKFYGRNNSDQNVYGIYAHGLIYDLILNSIDIEVYRKGMYITEQVNVHCQNVYIERCITGITIENLSKSGNVTIDGGVIAVPSKSAFAMNIKGAKECYINILGVHFFMPEDCTNGLYLENNNINNINIIGIDPKFIHSYPYTSSDSVNILSDSTFKNKKNYNHRLIIKHNTKQRLLRIYPNKNVNDICATIKIYAQYYFSNNSQHRVCKEYYFAKNASTSLYTLNELSVPTVEHIESYNYNAAFNIKVEVVTDNTGTYALILSEAQVIGKLQTDGAAYMEYYIECSSSEPNGIVLTPINEETGESITTIIENSYVSGNTRPLLTVNNKGYMYYDTTLNKPIWWTGEKWVDAAGADV